MAIPAPLPPTVSGPIFDISPQVYVDNLLPNSKVNVFNIPNPTSTTTPIGTATTSASPGGIWVPLTTKPSPGQQITATQQYTGTDPKILALVNKNPSPPSTSPVKVLRPPSPLPAPIFVSGLCTCMDSVLMGGLIPGATLSITMGGSPMVSAANVTQSTQWFQLAAKPIPTGSVLEAWQNIGASKSPTTSSSPPIAVAPALGAPVISPQPVNCQTNLGISNVVPGADLKIINGGTEYFTTNAWSSYNLSGLLPLQPPPAPSSAQQYFTRCKSPQGGDLTGPVASFTVAKQAPKSPTVGYTPCADVTELSVSDVLSGEILSLAVNYTPATPPGAKPVTQPLGACGVSGPGAVPLPNNWYPTGAVPGSVTLQIQGWLCDDPGPTVSVPVVEPPGPFPAPTVQQPLYDCATSVYVQGANPGSLIQVWSGPPLHSPAIPRSNPVVATTANFPVGLWWPLATGEQIYVQQQGCNANGQSKPAPVKGPPKLTVPAVAGSYVLTTATSALVNKVVPGAQVTLLLNGEPIQQVDSIEAETGPPPPLPAPQLIQVSVPVGVPLNKGDVLSAGQVLCNESAFPSPGQGGGVTVQAPVPAPSGGPGEPRAGLGSNANYYMFQPSGSGCANLLNVSVTLVVTEDIVWQSTGPAPPGCKPAPPTGTPGLSLQLNCFSPAPKSPNPGYPNWQQYIINLWGTQLLGAINTWNTFSSLVIFPGGEYTTPLGPPLPGPNPTLPKGYTLIITLGNDASGNVNSVTWVVNGVSYTTSPATIPALLTANGLAATDVAPIVAFTVNLVGPVSGESAVLSSGAGIITYSSKSPLTVTNAEPTQCVEGLTGFTCERASTSYGVLPASPGNPFSQTFAASAATPLIRAMRGRPLSRR